MNGYFDNEKDSIIVELWVFCFCFGNIVLNDVGLFVRFVDLVGFINFRVEELVFNDKCWFVLVYVLVDLDCDIFDIGLAY